jgi:hypothetical protein
MDYKRAVVIDTGPKETQRMKPLFRVEGEVRSKNDLTEPALLEMSGNACQPNRSSHHHLISWSANASLKEPIYLTDAAKT